MTGPDELRELADRLLTGGSNYLSLRNRLYAFADAWQLSDALASKALITLGQKQDEIDALRKRLEAAEIERAGAKWLLMTSPNNGGRAWCVRRDAWLAKQNAALAGRKP